MKLKLLAIAVMILSLNLGSNTVQADQLPVKVQVVAKTNNLAIPYLNAKQIKQQAKRDKLKRVVNYLTTRVHKTAYVFSGSTISGWDCSGMVRYAYKRMNIVLPHSADKQAHAGTRVSKPKVGDIVVFAYKGSTNFYHSAIYVGNDLVINANLLYKTTVIQPLSDFKNSQIRFVRVIQ
jgi:cell wall-associated NlpC family hydrolase